MSNSVPWQHFSVQEFFSRSNWEGGHQTNNLDEICQEISWLCLKIEDFFAHNNWQGELAAVNMSPPVFSLNLPVEEFWQCFAWEENPKIAALPELKSVPEDDLLTNNELHLHDLNNLF